MRYYHLQGRDESALNKISYETYIMKWPLQASLTLSDYCKSLLDREKLFCELIHSEDYGNPSISSPIPMMIGREMPVKMT